MEPVSAIAGAVGDVFGAVGDVISAAYKKATAAIMLDNTIQGVNQQASSDYIDTKNQDKKLLYIVAAIFVVMIFVYAIKKR